MLKKLVGFVLFSLTPFHDNVREPKGFDDGPEGKVTPEQLLICQSIYDEASDTASKIDQKATAMLSAIAIFVPLMISAMVFLRTLPEYRLFSLITAGLSLMTLSIAFIASFRALSVRNFQSMFLDAIIDPSRGKIKEFNRDDHGKGLLYCASVNTAVNNQRTEFLKASQALSMTAVFLLVLSALPALYSLPRKSEIQEIKGTVNVNSAAIETKLGNIGSALDSVRSEVQSMRRNIDRIGRNLNEHRKKERDR